MIALRFETQKILLGFDAPLITHPQCQCNILFIDTVIISAISIGKIGGWVATEKLATLRTRGNRKYFNVLKVILSTVQYL